jgi:glucose-1-phosphate adenylyltransferase
MSKKECLAMLLAGGQGSRLYDLTKDVAKPAVSFGAKYRIIDFPLSNCANSGINSVGVLTQYRPYLLHSYLGTGTAWNLEDGIAILPPYATQTGGSWYAGTADAVAQNLEYIELNDPEYVIILSGDALCRMDYHDMLETHKKNNADLTIAVMPVPWEDASRFGLLVADETGRITEFQEKPPEPKSNLASMGIYIFNTKLLCDELRLDAADPESEHDFGGNIIPKLLNDGRRLYTYKFEGFWRDVGTIASYHETSMELLGENPSFDLFQKDFPIMSNTHSFPPAYFGPDATVDDCIVGNGSKIYGDAVHSIVSIDSVIGKGAVVKDSVLLPGAIVKDGAKVINAIVGENSVIEEGVVFGSEDAGKDYTFCGNNVVIGKEE